MMKRLAGSVASVMLVILLASGPARAEEYTLESCINIALQNNYGVIAARNSYDAARGEIYTAWGDLLPTINLSTDASQFWSGYPSTDPVTGKPITGVRKTNSYSGSINFSQSYRGLGIFNYSNIKKKYHDRGSSYNGYLSAKSSLVYEVKNDYYSLLKAKMLLDVSQDAVKRGEERLRVVQSKYDLGSASMSDVLKAKVQYGSDKLDLVSKTNGYKLAKASLAYIMGIDVNEDLQVDENLPERTVDISFDGALKEAYSENPDYRKARFDLYGARDQKVMAYTNFLPSLSLGLSHGTSVDTLANLTRFSKSGASYRVYASLNFNIFNGASDYATLRAARRNVETARQGLKDTENKVALDVKQAFLDIEQSEETRKLAGESVAAAQEDLNLVREKYNLGAATILEVLDAEVSLKEAQTSRVQAIYDYNLAVSRLEKVMGR